MNNDAICRDRKCWGVLGRGSGYIKSAMPIRSIKKTVGYLVLSTGERSGLEIKFGRRQHLGGKTLAMGQTRHYREIMEPRPQI